MTWSTKIFIALFVIFTGFIVYLALRPAPRPLVPQFETQQQAATGAAAQGTAATTNGKKTIWDAGVINALAVNMLDAPNATTETVLSGKNPILVIVKEPTATTAQGAAADTTEPAATNVQLFNNLSSLAQYDLNTDGFIDTQDKIFRSIYLAYLDPKTATLQYRPISAANVTGIVINNNHLSLELANDPKTQETHAGHVVHAGGVRDKIVVVRLPLSEFSHYRTVRAVR